MNFDAFTAGMKLGGLRTQNEIKLLICYLLSSFNDGLSKEDVVKVFQENSLANYFEINNAFSELVNSGNIVISEKDNSKYLSTKSSKMIATQLETTLPVSIRKQAVASTLNLMAKIKLEKENKVELKKNDFGHDVICHISGGDQDLMSISVQVPDLLQAELIEKNFYDNPTLIYKCILAVLTKNVDLIKEILESLPNK